MDGEEKKIEQNATNVSYKGTVIPTLPVASTGKTLINGKVILPQTYKSHVVSVQNAARFRVADMVRYYNGTTSGSAMELCVSDAAWFHDLGKLMDSFQNAMLGTGPMASRGNHVFAGVCAMMKLYHNSENQRFLLSALLIEGHHIGLLDNNARYRINNNVIEDASSGTNGTSNKVWKHPNGDFRYPRFLFETDRRKSEEDQEKDKDFMNQIIRKNLVKLRRNHKSVTGMQDPKAQRNLSIEELSTLDLRMMFSCLVDADHMDASAREGGFSVDDIEQIELKPQKRLSRLNEHVKNISKHKTDKRNKMRECLYNEAMQADLSHDLYLIEATVGAGKTYSAVALGLRLAEKHNLRHIFGVSPYINTTSQMAEVWRKSLHLPSDADPNESDQSHPGERSVAEHHHLANYDNVAAKITGQLWMSPMTCVTGVQFYQTILNNQAFTLRKLHQLAGSVIIIDEYDDSLPPHMWRVIFRALKELTQKWGCKVILCSGTAIRPWETPELDIDIPEPYRVVSDELMQEFREHERRRAPVVQMTRNDQRVFTGHEILNTIERCSGPRLCITETRRNAALLAYHARRRNNEPHDKIYHLSTALSRENQNRIYKELVGYNNPEQEKKAYGLMGHKDIRKRESVVVFSTSLIETGVDISFRHGFIQARSVTSALQCSGRVNRHEEYGRRDRNNKPHSTMRAFILQDDNDFPFTTNPEFVEDRAHLLNVLQEGILTADHNQCQDAFNNIIRQKVVNNILEEIDVAELQGDLAKIRHVCQVIDNNYIPILVDRNLFDKIRYNRIPPSWTQGYLSRLLEMKSIFVPSYLIPYEDPDNPEYNREGRYQHVLLSDTLAHEWEPRVRAEQRINPDRIRLWDGLYDHKFYGYMAEELHRLGMPGMEQFENPAAGL